MSQKHEPQQSSAMSGQPATQQSSVRQPEQIQQGRLDFEDTLTRDMRIALHDIGKAGTVCNWCADECLGEMEMEACARLCRDVADLASLSVQFIARDSIFGVDVAESFAYAAEECAQVCEQHPDDHCQECASSLRRAADSTWAMLDSFKHISQANPQYQQSQQH